LGYNHTVLPKKQPALFKIIAPHFLKWYSKFNVAVYRATGGRIGSHELGKPVCLLTTIGRKSGRSRTNALVYMSDGTRVILVAAQGGLHKNPMWLLNLRENPEVQVQIGTTVHTMHARVVDDTERAYLWPQLTAMNPRWTRFQSWTDRTIPVVACEPI
jgi:deazaflavin-dependent oxidoreductase (nitroreductase family)